MIETGTLTYSGGTAPVFHRTSLLRPRGHLRFQSMHESQLGWQARDWPRSLILQVTGMARLVIAIACDGTVSSERT